MRKPLVLSATFSAALSATLSAQLAMPLAAEVIMLSGAHLSYSDLFSVQVKADGKTTDWDGRMRVEPQVRDYYFEQRTHDHLPKSCSFTKITNRATPR